MAKESKSALVPRLRFPDFQGESVWTEASLEDLVTTIAPPAKLQSSSYRVSGRFPIVDQSQQAICGWTDDASAVVKERPPLIVFGDHTCALKLVRQAFAQGADGIRILKAKPSVWTEYLFYSLSHRPLAMEDYKRHFSMLKERRVFYPDINTGEQQKIADCLTSLDEVIASQGLKVGALKSYKRSLTQRLFPREGETVPRLRLPEFRDGPDWTTGKASDIVDVLQGYGFPDRLQGSKDGEFPFYKVSDISAYVDAGKAFLGRANNHIDRDVLAELRAKPLPTGTTVFAKIGEAIRSNKRAVTTRACLVDNNAAGVKAIAGLADDLFVYYLWCQVPLIEYSGGVVPSVNKSAIEQIPVCYPEPREQHKISECLSSLDARIAAEAEKLEFQKAHKIGLMQQLLLSAQQV